MFPSPGSFISFISSSHQMLETVANENVLNINVCRVADCLPNGSGHIFTPQHFVSVTPDKTREIISNFKSLQNIPTARYLTKSTSTPYFSKVFSSAPFKKSSRPSVSTNPGRTLTILTPVPFNSFLKWIFLEYDSEHVCCFRQP